MTTPTGIDRDAPVIAHHQIDIIQGLPDYLSRVPGRGTDLAQGVGRLAPNHALAVPQRLTEYGHRRASAGC